MLAFEFLNSISKLLTFKFVLYEPQTHNKLVNFIWSIADENMHILVRDFRQGLRNHRQIRVSQIFM